MARPTTAHEPASPGSAAGSDAPTAFTAAVSAITDAFGDPTRRRIYLFTRDHGGADGVTASRGRRAVRPAPQRRPPPPRQARRRRLPRGRGRAAAGDAARRAARRSATSPCAASALDRRAGAQRRPRAGAARPGARSPAPPRGRGDGRGGRREYGRAMAAGLTGDALAAGQRSLRSAMQAVADALTAHGFAAHMASAGDAPTSCGSSTTTARSARGHRAPGDLRRRPRHGARACSSALYGDGDDVDVADGQPARPAATRSAPPPSDRRRPSAAQRAGRRQAVLGRWLLAERGVLDRRGSSRRRRPWRRAPASNGGCGSYSIISWHGLGRGVVDEQLDEAQRHVDAAGHAGGGDDPLGRGARRPARSSAMAPSLPRTSRPLQCVVAVSPSSSPAAASTSEPVHTDVVNVVVSWARAHPVEHPLVVDQRPGADAAGEHDDVGRGHLVERGVDVDAEEAVLGARPRRARGRRR